MQGFLTRDGMPPPELLAIGRQEVESYGGVLVPGSVRGITPVHPARFEVRLDDDSTHSARRLLIATGLRDELPDIPGLRTRFGRDVLHCPYCHGYEVRDRRVGVVGGSANSYHQVQLVRQWAADVVFFTNDTELTADQREQLVARAVGVVDGRVSRLIVDDDDVLCGVEVDGTRVVPREAVFVAPRFIPNSDLVDLLACAVDKEGWAVTDAAGRTSVPGVWVAGNAANPRAQVITAAGEGSAAAIAINADLVEEDVRNSVELFRLGLPA
jgi:thioredoxin reductase